MLSSAIVDLRETMNKDIAPDTAALQLAIDHAVAPVNRDLLLALRRFGRRPTVLRTLPPR